MIEEETSQLEKLDAESEKFTAVHVAGKPGRNKDLMNHLKVLKG